MNFQKICEGRSLAAYDKRYDQVVGNWGKLEPADMDKLWDWVKERLISGEIERRGPMDLVDNFLVNGDYNYIDRFKDGDESDEEFMQRRESDILYHFPGTRGEVIVFDI